MGLISSGNLMGSDDWLHVQWKDSKIYSKMLFDSFCCSGRCMSLSVLMSAVIFLRLFHFLPRWTEDSLLQFEITNIIHCINQKSIFHQITSNCLSRVRLTIIKLLNQIVLEFDFWTVKFWFFPRRDLNSH